MNTSLIILFVLVVVVLAAILLTSPTCKNAVASIRPNMGTGHPPVVLNTKKSKMSLAATAKKNDRKSAKSKKHAKHVEKKVPTKMSVYKQRKEEEQARKKAEAKALAEHPDAKVIHVEAAPPSAFKTLNGRVENLFDPVDNSADQFGLSEAQLDAMAMAYKKDHLDAPKVETVRHKSYVKSEVENAEKKIRESFVQTTLNSIRDPNENMVSDFYRDKAMGKSEKRSTVKMSFRSRK
tara:strand:+ start:3117 stop:3824 length:708 start_codon:yes stop_codon:yes gene_type:complete